MQLTKRCKNTSFSHNRGSVESLGPWKMRDSSPFPRARSDLQFCVELLRFREVLVTRHERSWRWFHFYKDTANFLCLKQMWSTSISMKSNLVISKCHCIFPVPPNSPRIRDCLRCCPAHEFLCETLLGHMKMPRLVAWQGRVTLQ